MIVIKCNKCGERSIADEGEFKLRDGYYIDECCGVKDYSVVPVAEYRRDEVISMVEGELENWNHHTLCESIARILSPIRSVKTLISRGETVCLSEKIMFAVTSIQDEFSRRGK